MIVTQAPKNNWIPALLFIVIAAALSAVVSYLVNQKLREKYE